MFKYNTPTSVTDFKHDAEFVYLQ